MSLFSRKPKIQKPLQLKSIVSESFDGYIHGLIYVHNPNTHIDHVIFDGYGYKSSETLDSPRPVALVLRESELRALMSIILDQYKSRMST